MKTTAGKGLEAANGAEKAVDFDFFDKIQSWTEDFLTKRRRRIRKRREKEEKTTGLKSWIYALLWAAAVVLVLNQYLIQAYQIPSGSMIDTLLIGDRLFVNKLVYGPEVLPGWGKLPSPIKPDRNNVIIFESPEYLSKGPVFDIAQRVIFMLTISLVDIDKDENGNPRPHFLIKREAGRAGDRFFNNQGDMYIRFKGETRVVPELDYIKKRGWNHNLTRLIAKEDYPTMIAQAKLDVYNRLGVNAPDSIQKEAANVGNAYPDRITQLTSWLRTLRGAYPNEGRYTSQYCRYVQGWYVPEGRVLPLGDNRDNSQDGRYFGPVRTDKVLGEALFIFYPGRVTQPSDMTKTGFARIGPVR